jgi:hypothetical protein
LNVSAFSNDSLEASRDIDLEINAEKTKCVCVCVSVHTHTHIYALLMTSRVRVCLFVCLLVCLLTDYRMVRIFRGYRSRLFSWYSPIRYKERTVTSN